MGQISNAKSSKKPQKQKQNKNFKMKRNYSNLIYLISSIIYASSSTMNQLVNYLQIQNSYSLKHKNILKTIQLETIMKKQERRTSTAAETKFPRSIVVSEQSDENYHEITFKNGNGDNNFRSPIVTPKSTNKSNNFFINNNKLEAFKEKYFSKVSNLLQICEKQTQKIIKDVHQTNIFSQFLVIKSLLQLQQNCEIQGKIMGVQDFYRMNIKESMSLKIDNIEQNYKNSIQQQFDSTRNLATNEIQHLVNKIYIQCLNEFYNQIKETNPQPQLQTYYLNQLTQRIKQIQSQYFQNINKSKKQSISRRIHLLQDQNYIDRMDQSTTKFQNLICKVSNNDMEIDFSLYQQTLKHKINQIFIQLIGENQYQKSLKTTKSKTINKKQLYKNNIDKRIELLSSQKKSHQQSLRIQEMLQQNLVQNLKGLDNLRKKQIDPISQIESD